MRNVLYFQFVRGAQDSLHFLLWTYPSLTQVEGDEVVATVALSALAEEPCWRALASPSLPSCGVEVL